MTSEREKVKNNFLKQNCKIKKYEIETTKADASNRRYDRIKTEDKSYLLMDAPPSLENISKFCEVRKIFGKLDLSVPEIYKEDIENGFLLIEDFGDCTLKNILSSTVKSEDFPDEIRIYERAIDALVHIHQNSSGIKLPDYSEEMMIKESLLFLEWYISVLNGEQIKPSHREQFIAIFKNLFMHLDHFPKVLVHRDYHAENLFWLNNEVSIRKVGMIDFQDAVIGSPAYDIVSLLEDARREVPDSIVQNSISRYLKAFPHYTRKDFMASYTILSLQRNFKIIGIFTRLAMRDKRPHYLSMLPLVWKYIHNNLKHPLIVPLKNLLNEIIPFQMKTITITKSGEKILV